MVTAKNNICFVVHTPFQLMVATIMHKKIPGKSLLIWEEDGRNQLDRLQSFIEQNWEHHRMLRTRGKKDPSQWPEIKRAACDQLEHCWILCLWSLHSKVNQVMMEAAKQKGITVYVFPEGLIIYDYFKPGFDRWIKAISGRYLFSFDFFFTYFGKERLTHPRVRPMPFLLTSSNLSQLILPEEIRRPELDFASFQGIYLGQPLSEGRILSPDEEDRYLEAVFGTLPETDRILVLLHPQEKPDKYQRFKNVFPLFNNHFPNEIWLHHCEPRYVLTAYSTILINSALIFPTVPHLMVYRTVGALKHRRRLQSLATAFEDIPNIRLLDAISDIPAAISQPVTRFSVEPALDEAEFFKRYFT